VPQDQDPGLEDYITAVHTFYLLSVDKAFTALYSMYCVAHMTQLFVFGLASPSGQRGIDYSAHYSAPKQIQSEYSVQP